MTVYTYVPRPEWIPFPYPLWAWEWWTFWILGCLHQSHVPFVGMM